MLAGSVPDNAGGGIFVGSAPPSSSLTNKVWFKIDGAGRPLGVFMFYNGNWRKVYNGVYGDIKMYLGNGGNFDGTGRGVVGSDCDGWAICNGGNGTPNMTDGRFPAGGSWNGANWISSGMGARGGANAHQITESDLPALQAGPVHSQAGKWQSGGGGGWLTTPPQAGATEADYNLPVFGPGGQTGGQNPLPPPKYQIFAFIMFIGYA